jgi:DNA transposition AAA+ family ATPase
MTQQSELAIHVPVEVVAPTIDITDLLAKAAAIEELFKAVFISTNRHSEYSRWLDELRAFKHCGRAIGPRHVGKSRSSAQYRDEHVKRVSHVEAWTNLSSQRLFSQILQDIKHAAWRGKRQDLRPRLAESLKLFGIELVLIDNAHHLQEDALIDLKQLHKESGVPIILIGSKKLDENLENGDLLTCFPTLFEFDTLDEKDFKNTLDDIEKILALPQSSNLSEGTLFQTLMVSTQAQIGVLIELISKVVLHSVKKGHLKIDEAVLNNIVHRYGKKYIALESRNVPPVSDSSNQILLEGESS